MSTHKKTLVEEQNNEIARLTAENHRLQSEAGYLKNIISYQETATQFWVGLYEKASKQRDDKRP
jgi:hypothetical protein